MDIWLCGTGDAQIQGTNVEYEIIPLRGTVAASA